LSQRRGAAADRGDRPRRTFRRVSRGHRATMAGSVESPLWKPCCRCALPSQALTGGRRQTDRQTTPDRKRRTTHGRQGLKSHIRKPHSAHCTPPANPIHPHPHPRLHPEGLTLSHLLHLHQTTTSHTSSCHSHRIAHAEPERVEHRSPQRQTPPWEIHPLYSSIASGSAASIAARRNLAIGPRQTGRRGRNFPSGRQNECTRSWARSLRDLAAGADRRRYLKTHVKNHTKNHAPKLNRNSQPTLRDRPPFDQNHHELAIYMNHAPRTVRPCVGCVCSPCAAAEQRSGNTQPKDIAPSPRPRRGAPRDLAPRNLASDCARGGSMRRTLLDAPLPTMRE